MSWVAADSPASPDPTTITGWGCVNAEGNREDEELIVVRNLKILFCRGCIKD
jgi:hypothetical protein